LFKRSRIADVNEMRRGMLLHCRRSGEFLQFQPMRRLPPQPKRRSESHEQPHHHTKDGTQILLQGLGQRATDRVHHGWPLSADDWDAQMMFFLSQGYGVIAHDRRGHGLVADDDRNEMDTYAGDVAELAAHLDLRNAIHVGHRPRGGEVARYVARHGAGRVAKAVLIGAVPPIMVKTDKNPGGLPIECRRASAPRSSRIARSSPDVPTGPFYGFNRAGAKVVGGRHQELCARA